jgi:GDA1/CD39 (nucleoside phosphatase) family
MIGLDYMVSHSKFISSVTKHLQVFSRILLASMLFISSQAFSLENNIQNILVVDIGSSGSRLHQYNFVLDNNNFPVDIHETFTRSINPGLSQVPLSQESINSYFDALFTNSNIIQNIKVYVYATAGMRLLSAEQQQQYYAYVQNWFAQQRALKLIELRTISGSDEALFAWLAVNDKLNLLQDPEQKMVGIIEVGGASTQIAFPVDIDYGALDNVVKVKLYQREIVLFAHSFLGLGLNQFASVHNDLSACYPKNYPLESGLMGNGNAYFCQQELAQILSQQYDVANVVAPAMQHKAVDTWYALGAIRYLVMQGFLTYNSNQFALQDLINDVDGLLCQKSWSDLQQITSNLNHLSLSCFLGSYFYALSVDAYGISANQNINWLDTTQNADWPLGALLALYAGKSA